LSLGFWLIRGSALGPIGGLTVRQLNSSLPRIEKREERPATVSAMISLKCYYPIRQQELSYRKQIARQLRTQYVEGIHRPKYYIVTLNSRLRVIQGHWKRNHWIDHTRLTISRVIWRWILSWPWNVD